MAKELKKNPKPTATAESTPGAPPPGAPSTSDPNLTAIAQGTRIDPTANPADVAAAADALDPASIGLPTDHELRTLIYRMERAALTGHGLDADRELLKEAAQVLRLTCGIGIDEAVAPTPGAYGPVKNDPPTGHSLPPLK